MSQTHTSTGSCLQLKDEVVFQPDSELVELSWPAVDYWIVGRELLIYSLVELSEIPKKQRPKVLGQKVRRLSPFDRTGRYVYWCENGSAMVWLWDEALRQQAVEKLCELYAPVREKLVQLEPLPETLLYPRTTEGATITRCIRGFDRQRWLDRRLVSSEWLPARTGQIDTPAEAEHLTLSEPWAQDSSEVLFPSERLWWRVGFALLAVVLAFQAGGYLGWKLESASLESQVETARSSTEATVQIRSKARRQQQENELMSRWLQHPSQLKMLAEFDDRMPATVSIREWNYLDGELKVTIEDEALDNRSYIESLSESTLFSSVQIEPVAGEGRALIRMQANSDG